MHFKLAQLHVVVKWEQNIYKKYFYYNYSYNMIYAHVVVTEIISMPGVQNSITYKWLNFCDNNIYVFAFLGIESNLNHAWWFRCFDYEYYKIPALTVY